MKISRRSLLKLGTVTGVAAGMGARWPFNAKVFGQGQGVAAAAEAAKMVPGACRVCGGNCGILGKVVDGRMVKIDGNPTNFNNRDGALCVKGNSGTKFEYDPDRVLYPLQRVGARGEGKFKRISWDEAREIVAEALTKYKETPEKVVFSGVINDYEPHNDFFKFFYGTPNMVGRGRSICDASKRRSTDITFGWEQHHNGYDFLNSKYIILWGRSISHGPHYAGTPRDIWEAKQKGAKVVVIDPRCQPDAGVFADEWVPIKAGTDMALALAMINVIVEEGLYDKEFVEKWTVGFDKLTAHIKQYTPAWAAGITGIPTATITAIAREFARTKPAYIDWQKGILFHSDAFQVGRAFNILMGITGNIDVPGGLVINVGAKKGTAVKFPTPPKRPGLTDSKKYPVVKSHMLFKIYEGILEDKVKVWFLNENNPLHSIPEPARLKGALESGKLELMVAFETHIGETAMYADLILPDATCYERWQVLGSRAVYPNMHVRTPIVAPLGEAKDFNEFILEVAKDMGYSDFAVTTIMKEYANLVLKNSADPEVAVLTVDAIKEMGGTWEKPSAAKYKKHLSKLSEAELAGTTVDEATGKVIKDGAAVGVMVDGVAYKGFNTPSKKFEIYSAQLAGWGYDALPTYVVPEGYKLDSEAEYPLRFVSYHGINTAQTNARTFNNPYLAEVRPENYLDINADTAARLGIRDGDLVEVLSAVGKVQVKAHITQGMQPDTVAMQHGFGHRTPDCKVANSRGASSNDVSRLLFDPIGGQVASNETLVKVRKIG
ncbi:hypothetical protein SY88_17955 [Clostridiales bacterium PH28_bin88]|nr:hypothetical protein SY88_17955 [Clostridiales bacterium PH28_bin88]